MINRRHLFPILACFASVPSMAAAPLRTATLLPEVNRHMEQARSHLDRGTVEVAMAHATVVLVGDRVRYTIRFQNVHPERHRSFERAFEAAVESWERLLDDTVRFHRIDRTEDADVNVRFMPAVKMHKEQVAGYVNWRRTIKIEQDKVKECHFKADLQLRTQTLEGTPMPGDAVKHAAMHEVGHVMGLDDSPRQGDIMGPLDINRPVARPQPHEVASVRALREEARSIREQARLMAGKQ